MKTKLPISLSEKVINVNNELFFSRNKGISQHHEHKTERVHKNSMEEWDERLKRKDNRKVSAVDRIIEKSEQKQKDFENSTRKINQWDRMDFTQQRKRGIMKAPHGANKLNNVDCFNSERPKSLDRGNNLAKRPSGVLKKFQYYSKEDILAADDENSDLDLEVAAITRNIQPRNIRKKLTECDVLHVQYPIFNIRLNERKMINMKMRRNIQLSHIFLIGVNELSSVVFNTCTLLMLTWGVGYCFV